MQTGLLTPNNLKPQTIDRGDNEKPKSRTRSRRKAEDKKKDSKPSPEKMQLEELNNKERIVSSKKSGENSTKETDWSHPPLPQQKKNKKPEEAELKYQKLIEDLVKKSEEKNAHRLLALTEQSDSSASEAQAKAKISNRKQKSKPALQLEPIEELAGQRTELSSEKPKKKKTSREIILQQEIKGMNKDKRNEILESINKKESKETEKKVNRLEEIMKNVAVQRTQYYPKKNLKTESSFGESAGARLTVNTLGSKQDLSDAAFSSVNSNFDPSRDESVGGSTKNQLSIVTKKTNKSANSANEKSAQDRQAVPLANPKSEPQEEHFSSGILRERPKSVPKLEYEISMLKERNQLLDFNGLLKKMVKSNEDSFSVDVACV